MQLKQLFSSKPSVRPVTARAWLGAPNSIKGPTEALFQHFKDAEAESQKLLSRKVGRSAAHPEWRHVLPAYEQCIHASHIFNLLDARGVISVTERQAYIGRVRALAKECAQAWVESPQGVTLGAGMSGMAR